jgi:hypothetical protein
MLKALMACLLGMLCVAARAASNCQPVGGTISTNFLDPATTFGSATGDLAGGIGVTVLTLTANPDGTLTFHNQHHWVTATGDTINLDPADATGYPSGTPGLYAAIYAKGATVSGGTGKFANATGTIFSWGAVNTAEGEVVLRYQGTVCYSNKK